MQELNTASADNCSMDHKNAVTIVSWAITAYVGVYNGFTECAKTKTKQKMCTFRELAAHSTFVKQYRGCFNFLFFS